MLKDLLVGIGFAFIFTALSCAILGATALMSIASISTIGRFLTLILTVIVVIAIVKFVIFNLM